jgi:hypothetical protein
VMSDKATVLLASLLLRACRPLRAHAIMQRVGWFLPSLRTPAEARAAVESLQRWGTCLSRALAVAARTPGADVVIGVQPDQGALRAHAWLELSGEPVDQSAPAGCEIARLPGRRLPERCSSQR